MKIHFALFVAALLVQPGTVRPAIEAALPSPPQRMFCSASSVIAVLPPKSPLKRKDQWSAPLIAEASSLIQRDVQGQQIILRSTVELLQPFEGGFRIKLPDGDVQHNGESVGFRIWAYFGAAATHKLSKVSTGDTVVFTGRIRRADLQLYPGDKWPSLCIDIAETEIYVDPDKAK